MQGTGELLSTLACGSLFPDCPYALVSPSVKVRSSWAPLRGVRRHPSIALLSPSASPPPAEVLGVLRQF